MPLYAIGDVHGYRQPLLQLLDEVSAGPEDTLIFLGDYVDKGPDVSGTLDLLIQLNRDKNCIFLRGNHDQLLLDAIKNPDLISYWECLAGNEPLASYGQGSTSDLLKALPPEHVDFLENICRDYHETNDFIFVHGGIRPHLAPEEEDQDHLLWLTLSSASPHNSGRRVICGHSAQSNGRIADLGHTICIDTAITKGQFITCLNLKDFSYIQVSSERQIRKGQVER